MTDDGSMAVRAAVAAFEARLDHAPPADLAVFVQERVSLARAVNDFLAAERVRIDALTTAGAAEAVLSSQRCLYQSLVDLRMRYSGHISCWTTQRMADEWRLYARDCARLIAEMRRLLGKRTGFAPPADAPRAAAPLTA